ncbi:TPA: hypothetical protein QDE50_15995 [Burkholderia cenocepacia]|nr:hypothetical protein [Burkholderia cenocepacia]HDR9885870.1 hypothetical protein [Burkholderia cenocepacia]
MGTDGEKRRVKARFVSDRIRRKTASAPACVRPTGTPDRAPMDAAAAIRPPPFRASSSGRRSRAQLRHLRR